MTGVWQVVEIVVNSLVGGLLVLATWFLYRATKELAAAARRAEERERERDEPRVGIGAITGEAESGFSITNIGQPEVTIVQVAFAHGIPVEEDGVQGRASGTTPKVVRRDDVEVALPQRLRHGDAISAVYDTATLVEDSRETRLQPVARDSLGNIYPGAWLEYREEGARFFDDPGEGLRPSQMY